MKSYFTFNIGLGLADKFDYSQILGERCEIAAEKNIPGRGMIRNPAPVEFQVALPVNASSELFRETLVKEIAGIAETYGPANILPIPSVPERPDYNSFISDAQSRGMTDSGFIPLGYDMDEANIISVDLSQMYCYTICGQQRTGKTNALKLIMQYCKKTDAKTYLFYDGSSQMAAFAEKIAVDRYIMGDDQLYQFSKEILIPEFMLRGKEDAQKRNYEPIFVFIHNLLSFAEAVYSEDYPMSSFFENIFRNGNALNIYFIGVMLVNAVNERIYPNALRNFFAWNSGILLGGKVIEQNIFDFDIPFTESSKKLPPGTGYTFANYKTVKIKLPLV